MGIVIPNFVILGKSKSTTMKSFSKTVIILGIAIVIAIMVYLLFFNKKEPGNQPKIKEIFLIQYNDSPLSELSQEGILIGLSEIGLKKDVDYKIKIKNAQGDISTLNLLIDEAVNSKPDLIFVTSTPTLQVAAKKIKNIPVIFTVVADPMIAGVATSFTKHLPNITGISTLGDYEGMIKRLKILMPNAQSIGTLYTPGEANSIKNMNDLKLHAEKAGLSFFSVPVNSSGEVVDATLALIENNPDAICQIIDNLTSSAFSGIAKISIEQRIPLLGFVSDQVEKGAILVVSRNYQQAGIDAAMLAQKVFSGIDPADIPIEFVSKTDVYFNPEAATYYGVSLPDELLNSPDVIKIHKTIE